MAQYTPGISRRENGVSTFQHSGLKNASAQSSEAGSVTASRVYDAYGNLVSATGTWQGPFGYGGSFGYQEEANGLKLLGHRYYDPDTGRFLTADPIGSGKNWYAYAGNNPISGADTTGNQRITLPSNPGGLLEEGWTQGRHGGTERVPGEMGDYWPPGVDGTKDGDVGVEFNPTRERGTVDAPHYHRLRNRGGGDIERGKDHLEPGTDLDLGKLSLSLEGRSAPNYYPAPATDWTGVIVGTTIIVGLLALSFLSGGASLPITATLIGSAATLVVVAASGAFQPTVRHETWL